MRVTTFFSIEASRSRSGESLVVLVAVAIGIPLQTFFNLQDFLAVMSVRIQPSARCSAWPPSVLVLWREEKNNHSSSYYLVAMASS